MKDYCVIDDLLTIKELRELSDEDLAKGIGIGRATIARWKSGQEDISEKHTKAIYEFAFRQGIRLNRIKEQLFREDYANESNIVLFHGAKTEIQGKMSLDYSKEENDFGKGFYCGENLEQSAMFVAGYPKSSLYICKFSVDNELNHIRFNVDREWMLAIAYYRKRITAFNEDPTIRKILEKVSRADYCTAPIADNRMFQIIDEFIDGEITDIQCQHALSATNLGMQYVFVSQKALDKVEILRHCYLSDSEKQYYLTSKQEENRIGNDKVKLAKREYRGQGLYIDQILK